MKKDILIVLFVLLPIGLWAQGQGLQLALKGGISQWTGKDIQAQLCPMGGLDLGYTIRWRMGNDTQLGLRSGLGFAYATSQFSATLSDQYSRTDYYSNTLQYTTSASATEKHQQLQLDIPVLFALQTHGFTIHLGPKLIYIASDRYTQTVDQADIQAFYPRYGVTVRNTAPTGRLVTPYSTSGSQGLPSLTLALSGEIGYEWSIGERYSRKSEQYIGVQVFVDYGLKSFLPPTQEAFLSVAPITAARQTPAVFVGTIAAANSLNLFSAGLRVYYTIQSVDYPGRGWHRYRR